MRASRLVHMLLVLQGRELVTARELAHALEVSMRTVYRDIEALSAAGVPVYAERGASGGFRLLQGHRFAVNALTPAEAEALPLRGSPEAAAELGLRDARSALKLKVLAALPREAQARAEAAAQRVHIDATDWEPVEPSPHLRGLRDAIERRRVLRLRVRAPGTAAALEREVQPLGLVRKAGAWHLVVGEGVVAEGAFALHEIEAVTATAQHFERPAGFDLAKSWRRWVTDQRGRGETQNEGPGLRRGLGWPLGSVKRRCPDDRVERIGRKASSDLSSIPVDTIRAAAPQSSVRKGQQEGPRLPETPHPTR